MSESDGIDDRELSETLTLTSLGSMDARRSRFVSLVSMLEKCDQEVEQVSLVFEHQGQVQVVPLEDVVTVGRGAGNMVVIKSNYISTNHFKITEIDPGKFEISDLQSKSGTLVNEVKVGRTMLRPCDRISAADTEFILFDQGSRTSETLSARQRARINELSDSRVEEIKGEVGGAWEDFFTENYPVAVRYARRMGVRVEEAEDLAQKALLKVVVKLRAKKVESPQKLSSFFIGVVRGEVLNFIRKRKEVLLDEESNLISNHRDPTELDQGEVLAETEASALRQSFLVQCLDRIGEQEKMKKRVGAYRLYIQKRYLKEGGTPGAMGHVAGMLDMPVSTLENWIGSVKNQLSSCIETKMEEYL